MATRVEGFKRWLLCERLNRHDWWKWTNEAGDASVWSCKRCPVTDYFTMTTIPLAEVAADIEGTSRRIIQKATRGD